MQAEPANFGAMKFSLPAILLLPTLALAVETPDTAYTALRVVGRQKSQGVLSQVIELRGRNGAPQPSVWKVILNEPGARGGLREIEVQRGKLIAERTPTVREALGAPMNLNNLNLDSDGLFTVVNQECQKQGQGFDRVDYALRSGSGKGAPVWTAEIFDGRNGRIGSMQVAADSGTVLARNFTRTTPPPVAPPPPQNDRDYVNPRTTPNGPPPPPPEEQGGWSEPGEKFRGVGDFFHRLGKRMERRGTQLKNFVTGH